MRVALLALAAQGCRSRSEPEAPPPPSAPRPDAVVVIDAAPAPPPDAPPRAVPAELAALFPDRRPEIPPSLGIRFGEPIEAARRALPPASAQPRIDVVDEDGRVKQVFVAELAVTTDDLRVLWGQEPTFLDQWADPERGVRAIATGSPGPITIRIERYQPLAALLAKLPLRPAIGLRALAAAVGGDAHTDPPEVRLPPIEGDDKIGSTSIYVRRDGYTVTLYGGHDDVHAALVAQWGQPHVDELRGPEIFMTSPRVTARWNEPTGYDGAWMLTVGADDPRP